MQRTTGLELPSHTCPRADSYRIAPARMCRLIVLTLFLQLVFALSLFAQPDTLWSRNYGGINDDECFSVIQTPDNGFVMAGYTGPFGGWQDGWLLRTSANGDSLWSHPFGYDGDDYFTSIIHTADGGYAAAGVYEFRYYTGDWWNYDPYFWLLKTDSVGHCLWEHYYKESCMTQCNALIQTNDGGFALAGVVQTYDYNSNDLRLLKTDANGVGLWLHNYGGRGWEEGTSLIQTEDGGFVLAGVTGSFGAGSYDFWLLRTNADGDSLWSKTYGGSGTDYCTSMIQTADGGFALAGYSYSFRDSAALGFLVKTDADGDSLWAKWYGSSGESRINSIIQMPDEGFLLGGFATFDGDRGYDGWLLRTDAYGDSLWSGVYGGAGDQVGYSLIRTTDGGYALGGANNTIPSRNRSFWLLKTAPDKLAVDPILSPVLPIGVSLSQPYPNPFNSSVTVAVTLPDGSPAELGLFDTNGRQMMIIPGLRPIAGPQLLRINGTGLSSGTYLLRLTTPGRQVSREIQMVK